MEQNTRPNTQPTTRPSTRPNTRLTTRPGRAARGVLAAALLAGAAGGIFAAGGAQGTTGSGAAAAPALNFSGYPMNAGNQTISWWTDQYTLGGLFATPEEAPFHSGLAKNLGVKIAWTFPTEGTPSSQAFNLMLTNTTYPDIIAYGGIMGQSDQLIDEGVIRDLTPYLQKYAPNYWAYLKKNPILDKASKTDSGKYFGFLFFREDWGWNDTYEGPMIRKDWLDALGLPVPKTISDWDTTLRAFKDKYGAVMAFPASRLYGHGFAGAFGAFTLNNFSLYVDKNGKIQCANIQNEYKAHLTKLNEWWKAGLIDPDMPSSSDSSTRTLAQNGKVGAAYSALSQLSIWREDAAKAGTGADWIGIPYPTGDDGTLSMIFGGYGVIGFPATVSTSCPESKIELVLRALDYGYSPEGMLYWNFGNKGVSWDYGPDGKVQYTPLVLNDPMGMTTASGKYSGATGYGTCVQATRLIQIRLVPEAVAADDTWYYTHQDVSSYYTIPPGVSYTSAESQRRGELQTPMGTYASEMAMKFITGDEPLSNFDKFTAQIKSMGLDELLKITQSAYDRFKNR